MANNKPAAVTRVVSFYHKVSGLFHARHLMSSDAKSIALNTPDEHIAIDGDHFDRLSQRIDVKTGKVIDLLPTQPSDDHEWNATDRRWQMKPEVVAKEETRRHAILRITQLEMSGVRSLRELALGEAKAADRLKALDSEIAALRKSLDE
ncbi:MAG TPA: hypothetical protein VII41_04785 [Steroidobacteraceae bacterium]